MNLVLKRRDNNGVLILDLIGDLTLGPEDALFRATLDSCLASGHNRMVLNCGKLGEIDSAGVGTLLLFSARLHRGGGNAVLVDLSARHMDVLLLLKLETSFQVFVSEAEAVDSFFPDRVAKPFDVLDFVHRVEPLKM